MNSDKRQQCRSILDTMQASHLTLEDLLVHSLLTRKEQLLDLVKTFPEQETYREELAEVRSQLLSFGE